MEYLPKFDLIRKPCDDDSRDVPGFEWAPADVGKRHQLGGKPDFIQGPNWPDCNDCSKKMTFYGQLDSIGDEYMIADCGLVYVFICFDCYTSTSVIQSY